MLFFPGLALLVGGETARAYVLRRDRVPASAGFLGGAALVLAGWPLAGFALEAFGFVGLFGQFAPAAVGFVRAFGGGLFRLLGLAPPAAESSAPKAR